MSFNKVDDCVGILQEVSQGSKTAHKNKLDTFYSTRFCSQEMFNILVSGGFNLDFHRGRIVLDRLQKINGTNLKVVKNLKAMTVNRFSHKTVYCRSAVYVFGGFDSKENFIERIHKN